LREELEGAAARPVVAVTGSDAASRPAGRCVRRDRGGAASHPRSADVVAFLEFDSEMLAPRFRASEQALALIVRAGRIAPEVMIQTFSPDHEVIAAASAGDPARILEPEQARRRLLGLPPFGALALVSGAGADELVATLPADVEVGGDGADRFLVRAASWTMLGLALNAAERPSGSRIRVEVDPARI
jgi:primosomal protein N' (replication factor Y) (superfamily II helicase)